MSRHIAVLTGKRGGYGAMKPMLRAIHTDPGLRLSLIVTDQHLNPQFGATASEVRQEFPIAAAVPMEQAGDSPIQRSEAIGVCLSRMSRALGELKPDILVLYGDRGEVLASAVAAVNLGIPVAHIQGGDITGNVDDLFRHATTKLAHLHFPASQVSAERIERMGEESWRIHVVGDNHIDPIVAGDYTAAADVRRRFQIPDTQRPIVVLYHPETVRQRDNYADMHEILDVTLGRDRRTIVIYPCSDQGYAGIVDAIEEIRDRPNVSVHRNIDAPDFLGLMSIADALVGNSSAGIIEAPYFALPAINIGARQEGRARAENVIDADPARASLECALKLALDDEAFRHTVKNCGRPFGDGRTGRRIVEILRTVDISTLAKKRMTF